jgi:asparagine synthetase B (glutamine-hydrolysing)
MGALFVVRTRDPAFADAALAGARAQFVRHGLAAPAERERPGWRILHAPHILGGPETFLEQGEDFVAVAGTLTCDGRIGRPALEALLAMDSPPDWRRLGGQFVALVHKAGRTLLFTDYFAAFQLFRDAEARLFSTSFLAAAGALPSLRFNRQAVYEMAFNVVPIGDDSVFEELRLLGPEAMVELTADGATFRPLAKPLPAAPTSMTDEERLARQSERLSAVVRAHAGPFGDRICCPLSGGLDSRLVLAALRAEGLRPHVYVYGRTGSEDVDIALRIGRAEGFEVEWVDKGSHPAVAADAFPERVEANFQDYDGLPVYGEIFESGANAAARDARHPGGALAASGGCGEIFRNFFYLPDRPAPAAAIARTFFARYDRRDLTAAFDERSFLGAIEDKILAALGVAGERGALPRPLIEQIYPRLRCRSFFGREISLEGRYAPYLMPFLDHHVVAEAMTLPMALKHAGRFEAKLAAAIDPDLARQPSAYGHHFAEPPGARHLFSEWSSRVRPAWLRQKSYALQRRLRRGAAQRTGYLADAYLGRVLDLEFPAMRRFFRIGNVADQAMLMRIANLEYLAQRLGSKVQAS